MLGKLLVRYLKPFWPLLIGVIVFQAGQSIAALTLPNLNADIIDKGVVTGDVGFILSNGSIMLGITLIQIACSIAAVYFGARTAMGLGRDLRSAVFTRVGEFSEREVSKFGAPSLITRTTNDVQQVQMLVLMTCTMLIATPIQAVGGVIFALRTDVQLSLILVVAVPALLIAMSFIIVRMVPLVRTMQNRIDTVNRVMREQLTGMRVVRAFVREPVERERFGVANDELTNVALKTGRLFALMFPMVMLVLNVSSVAVLWFGAQRVQAGDLQI